ncbi:MAG: peptidylprolyl isomerase [Bacteroidales bacterium]|jgi:peptidyl-prolyl cis-trans isomerase B (cyclophilin B)|nr:peptidylprolyl isomerase [Bacteroidales bacterium]HOL97777.1 peptidylprolyl isomerase [Bacteroidales bacterium]HOM35826.1 peptidylprolyl isomerase [Bacteroidales bacterium]HPD23254.1 peptidylprolyl isomerase [Bacteroidales bacterium]HRS99258.1 peptidylprolyl isomerase [Bacteroidales bacterium]
MKIQKLTKIFFICIITLLLTSCNLLKNPVKITDYALIKTTQGDFVIGLYYFTEQHRKNFISNVEKGVYDSTLFYSVIPNSVQKAGLKQGVDENIRLKENYQSNRGLKPEFHKKIINKRSAVGMWRLPDNENPKQLSDPEIFYVVQGIKAGEKVLQTLESKRNAPLIADYMTVWLQMPENMIYKDSLDFYKTNRQNDEYLRLYGELSKNVLPLIEADGKKLFKLSDYQKKVYQKEGGIPIYDYSYTVFGEVLYGYETIEKISSIKTKLNNKPFENIMILSAGIISKTEYKKLKNKK